MATLLVPACTPTAPDCTKPEIVCVGLVTDVGKVTDQSFNQSSWDAIQQAKDDGLVQWIQYIETISSKDYGLNIATFCDADYDIVVTSSFNLGADSIKFAKLYPNIIFISVDQSATVFTPVGETTPANFIGVAYQEDQSGFLVGALAAMMSTTHKIGAVAGLSYVPPVWRYGEGFRAGAAYADEQNGTTTVVSVEYHDDVDIDKAFTDPVWGQTTATSMVENGVDVIFGIRGTTGNAAVIEATLYGAYGIGVDTDQYYGLTTAQPYLLSSAVKNIYLDVYTLIRMASEETIPGGVDYPGTNGYAPFHDTESKVPAEVKAMMSILISGLADDTIQTKVPSIKPAP